MSNKRSKVKRTQKSRRTKRQVYSSRKLPVLIKDYYPLDSHRSLQGAPKKITLKKLSLKYKQIIIEEQLSVNSNVCINIKNINGTIEISGHNKKSASILVVKRCRKKVNLDYVKVKATINKKELTFTTKYLKSKSNVESTSNIDVSYILKVPYNAVVELARNTNGSIITNSLRGPIKLKTTNGSINCNKSRNNVIISSVNGSINVDVDNLSKDQIIDLKTTNSSIKLTVPKKIRTIFDARVNIGNISTNIPITYESRTFMGKTIKGVIGNKKSNSTIKLRANVGSISIKTH